MEVSNPNELEAQRKQVIVNEFCERRNLIDH